MNKENWSSERVKELTMRKIQNKEYTPSVRRYGRRIAVIAAAAVLTLSLATVALGAAGVLDFGLLGDLSRRREVLPEAAGLVQTPNSTAQVETISGDAKFTVLETLWDGQTLFVTCEIAPPDEQTLLVSETEAGNIDENFPMTAYYYNFEIDNAPSLAEYMSENGYTKILYAGASLWNSETDASLGNSGYHYNIIGGKLIYYIESQGNYSQLLYDDKVSLLCTVYEPRADGLPPQRSDYVRTSVPVKYAPAPSSTELYVFEEEAVFPTAGVTVHRVKSWSSEIATYVTINWTITDETAYEATDGGLTFELLDENGERIDTVGGGSSGNGITEMTLGATADFSETITIQAFNCWTKERYESVTMSENSINAKQQINPGDPNFLGGLYDDEWWALEAD
ncbi:MAG: hypothetical protein LBN97_08175 [Oscillospiraceae bacterium]|jgi:hypothetical protein|nr:hypothetical protein [Oscillospiraceae bacterium]